MPEFGPTAILFLSVEIGKLPGGLQYGVASVPSDQSFLSGLWVCPDSRHFQHLHNSSMEGSLDMKVSSKSSSLLKFPRMLSDVVGYCVKIAKK